MVSNAASREARSLASALMPIAFPPASLTALTLLS
jgi:hypothetical protein